MRASGAWLAISSVLLAAIGCQPAGVPVTPAALPVPAADVPVAPAGVPSRIGVVTPSPGAAWLAFGDSLTLDAFGTDLAWKAVFGADAPPAINAGMRGDTAATALARLDGVLRAHPGARYVGLAFGTNDASGRVPIEVFEAQLQTMIDQVRAAGRTPMLATIPYSPDSDLTRLPEYNEAIKALERRNDLPAGPDLYSLVRDDESLLQPDGVHLTVAGNQAVQRAWATAARRLAW